MTHAPHKPLIHVLLVEDNPGDARLLHEMLRDARGVSFSVETTDRLQRALARLRQPGIDVVLLDLGLPDSVGLETFRRAHREFGHAPIVVISGLADEDLAADAVRDGAQDYLIKGQVDGQLLTRVLRYARERARSENALRQSESRYRSLVQDAPYGIYVSSEEGRFVQVNRALVEMLGYENEEEVLALDISHDVYLNRGDRVALVQRFRTAEYVRAVDVRWKRKDQSPITVRVSGRAIRGNAGSPVFEMIVEDVTDVRALEQQLRHAQKMQAVGRLAGGVAHDFNNLLTVIFGEVEIAEMSADDPDAATKALPEIRRAAERAAALTRQLLTFSRQQVVQPVSLDLNELVGGMRQMMRRLIREDIELVVRLAPEECPIVADRGQMEQVLANLIVNARDAMSDGGRLSVETTRVTLDADYARLHGDISQGDYVALMVGDTGSGMSPEVQARVFEPFFTTKGEQGTGLGLATCYGIVSQGGGHIQLYSEEGVGTMVKVYFPLSQRTSAPPRPEETTEDVGGTETILLVEDEEQVRKVTARMLRARGYRVLEASRGIDALSLLRQSNERIGLLLSDVVLPGMSGRELADRVKELWPAIRIIFVSGYTDDIISYHQLTARDTTLIQKPFTANTLARTVRKVLDQGLN